MSTARRLAAVSGLVLMVLSAGAASAAPLPSGRVVLPVGPAAAGAAHVKLSPASGPPASTVAVSGSGFGASKTVDIYFDTTNEAHAVTNASGQFRNIEVSVPVSAVPGGHWVRAVQRHFGPHGRAAFTVSTNWSQFRYSAAHTGYDPYENVLGPGNVAGLGQDWSFTTNQGMDGPPAVANGVVYVPSGDGNVYALNASTGAKLRSYGMSINASPAMADGVVYAESRGDVYAVNASTGAKLWSYAGGFFGTDPVVANGVVYIGALNGPVYAFSLPGGLAAPARPRSGSLYPGCRRVINSLRRNRIRAGKRAPGGAWDCGVHVIG